MKAAAPAKPYIWATGRRKTAVAQVRIAPGQGAILINRKKPEQYFNVEQLRREFMVPLNVAEKVGQYDLFIRVRGGGIVAQAGAIRHGIARALVKVDPSVSAKLKEHFLLTRDPRMKERKKYGKRGARRGQQYSKR